MDQPEAFERWLRAPVEPCPDPRFVVRQAGVEDLDEIFDVVDAAFDFVRPRAVYDWLYRRNPRGPARCWVVVEKDNGRIAASRSEWPWPLSVGSDPVAGLMCGDTAVLPRWKRQGLSQLRYSVSASHPEAASSIKIVWPNEQMRGHTRKHGRSASIMGPVRRAVLPVASAGFLRRHGVPSAMAAVAGGLVDPCFRAWQGRVLGDGSGMQIVDVDKFDADLAAIADAAAGWHGYRFPRDADFLNWRYLSHPQIEYRAFAVMEADRARGCAVVRLEKERAILMELAAPPGVAQALLLYGAGLAGDAGLSQLEVYASPHWHHWPLVRRAGFIDRPSQLYMIADSGDEPRVRTLSNWQFLAGDVDSL